MSRLPEDGEDAVHFFSGKEVRDVPRSEEVIDEDQKRLVDDLLVCQQEGVWGARANRRLVEHLLPNEQKEEEEKKKPTDRETETSTYRPTHPQTADCTDLQSPGRVEGPAEIRLRKSRPHANAVDRHVSCVEACQQAHQTHSRAGMYRYT